MNFHQRWFGSEIQSLSRRTDDLFVPERKRATETTACKRKRYPRSLRKLTSKKRHLWRKLRSNKDDVVIRREYRDCVNEWQHRLKSFERKVENSVIESNDVGAFYKHVNKRLTYRRGIGALVDNDGNIVSSDSEKASLLNSYFASVGVVDDGLIPCCDGMNTECILDTVEFSASNVMTALGKLKGNLSSGPDGLPPLFFKRLKHCIAEPLAMVYTQLLSVAAVPAEWKRAIITPVFKKGPAGNVCNYRPISLTCVPSKVMERVIAQQIYDHLMSNNSDVNKTFLSRPRPRLWVSRPRPRPPYFFKTKTKTLELKTKTKTFYSKPSINKVIRDTDAEALTFHSEYKSTTVAYPGFYNRDGTNRDFFGVVNSLF